MRIRIAITALALLLVACGRGQAPAGITPPGPVASDVRVVNVYNWADNIDPTVVPQFERETGVKVNYDTFDSQEMLETKLLTGKTGYDVVVVSGQVLERLIKSGAFRKLDPARLPNRSNLDSELMAVLATDNQSDEYAVGYQWGTTGIGIDAVKVRALAPDAPLDSWALVYDTRFVSRLASCGVSLVDSPADVIPSVLTYLGRDPNSGVPSDLASVRHVLAAIRPFVRRIDSGSQPYDLASGDMCVMVTWATNVVVAGRQGADAGKKTDFRYIIPREGTVSWVDTLAIPADAPHVAEAHTFINYLLRADIAARTANFLGIATLNKAAWPLLESSMRNDPAIYPPPEVRAKLRPLQARSVAQSRTDTDIWRDFRMARRPAP